MMAGPGFKGELEARLARQRSRVLAPSKGQHLREDVSGQSDKTSAGNTHKENSWITEAFGEIGRVFGDMLDIKIEYVNPFSKAMLTKNSEDIYAYAKVLDAGDFAAEFAKGEEEPLPRNITVPAFTRTGGHNPHPMMYFRRDLFNTNPSTAIHEMLHFLTHPSFRSQLNEDVNEAVTEYFTRMVLEKPAYGTDCHLRQRANRYEAHFEWLKLVRTESGLRDETLKSAYFQGSGGAIALIQRLYRKDGAALTAVNNGVITQPVKQSDGHWIGTW